MKKIGSWFCRFCFFAIAVLFSPWNFKILGCAVAAAALMFAVACFVEWKIPVHRRALTLGRSLFYLILWFLGAVQFITSWAPSSLMTSIASLLHLNVTVFLTVVALGLCVFAFIGAEYAYAMLVAVDKEIWRRLPVILKNIIASIVPTVIISVLQFWALEYSCLDKDIFLSIPKGIMIFGNFLVILSVDFLLAAIFQQWRRGLYASTVLFSAWSVANYYVIDMHGSPLFLTEFANIGAAANVIGGYSLTFSTIVMADLCVFVISLAIAKAVPLFEKKFSWKCSAVFLFAAIILGGSSFLIYKKNGKAIGSSWEFGIQKNGFLLCVVEDLRGAADAIVEPDGYTPDAVAAIAPADNTSEIQKFPDVIVILNETFSDLEAYTPLHTDVDPMASFRNIPGAYYGTAAVPNIGGTNNSEFELLTSKSMYLIRKMAPFNFIDFTKSDSSVVSYLKTFGYTSAGLHCGAETTYSRREAYPALGFDKSLFNVDNFTLNFNGTREWLDSDNYDDLLRVYNEAGEGPRFMYMLTYQNHGGYEQNDDSLDTVHTGVDFGDVTDDVNEYLSSMALSCKAFRDLTNRLSKSNRPVIVLMVGDHNPSFIRTMESEKYTSKKELDIARRTVPFVMWSNCGVNFSAYAGKATMVDLVPMLLGAAGFPMTSFYQTILEIHEKYPVRLSTGTYVRADGKIKTYKHEDGSPKELQTYYFMEYNSLIGGDNYQRQLFFPQSSAQ